MARLKGSPLASRSGLRRRSPKNVEKFSPAVLSKPAISTVPTTDVLKQVSTNRARLIQGNFPGGASSNKISAGGLNELFMKHLQLLQRLLKRLQVFAGLETHSLSGRDVDFGTSAGIPTDSRFSRFDREDAKASQLNPIVSLESVLHAIENRVDGLFRFRFADSRSLDDLIYEIEFDHWNLRFRVRNCRRKTGDYKLSLL